MSRTIRISDETFRRLQRFGTGFAGSERGTPEKAIAALLDAAEHAGLLERLTPAEPEGVEYTVRDPETGRVLEIVCKDGTRIYAGPPAEQ